MCLFVWFRSYFFCSYLNFHSFLSITVPLTRMCHAYNYARGSLTSDTSLLNYGENYISIDIDLNAAFQVCFRLPIIPTSTSSIIIIIIILLLVVVVVVALMLLSVSIIMIC
jgi:hypothetical protein